MKVGIVGCGSISATHARALAKIPQVNLTCAADICFEKAESLTQSFGGTAYDCLETMLSKEDISVLHICTPHYLHTPMAQSATEKGIAVFMEKPPIINKGQWELLSKLAQVVPIGVCFQNRYNPGVQYILSLLKQEDWGAFLGGRAFVTWCRDSLYYIESGWRGRWETEGGGVLINQAIHTIDLLLCFLGRPKAVRADMNQFHLQDFIDVEDELTARILFSSCYGKDVPVLFYATTGYCSDAPILLEIEFEKGSIRLEGDSVTTHYKGKQPVEHNFKHKVHAGKSYWGNGHTSCIQEFYKAIQSDNSPPIGIPQVKNTMDLVLGIYESALSNQIITL